MSVTNLGSYDGLGRVTASSQQTEGQTYGFTYQYNLADGMTRMSYPSGKVVSFVYDGAGRVNAVKKGEATSADTYASELAYYPQGAISTMKLGNGVVETTSYNSRLQMTRIGARWDTTTLLQVTNEYGTTNNNGNVVSQSISRSSLPGLLTQGFGYDGANRIQTAGEDTAWTRTFGYDRYGNQWVSGWTGQLSPGSFTPQSGSWYDGNNRMVGAPSGQFDGVGNQTQLGGYGYAYDGEGHQRSSTINSVTTAYGYDGDGRRVKKVAGASTQVYVYDALGNLAAEYGALDSAGTRYLTVDHLGSTRLVTNGSGGESVCYDYLPSGEEIPAGVNGRSSACYGAAGPTQRFTGKERDTETGLDFFGARYFSGAQGRFTSVDPENRGGMVPDPQSWNGYAYGRNNPLKYVDPDGERYRVCDSDGKNCADISDQEFYDFQQQNKNLFSFTGKGQILNNGNLTGTFQQTSVDLDPLAALVLRSAGETADREIKQFAKDVVISTATGFVLGGVFQGAQAAGRLLPFKDARLLQRVSNVLDELASGRRSFQKAREFLNDARAGGQALPAKGPGYYREFTVQPASGVSGRGAERLVVGQGGEVYYTPNHYGSFVRIQ